jgi:hypothetical protein
MACDLLKTETPKQKQFREDMEAAGIEITDYSGRGMCGNYTYGVYCGRDITEQEVYGATKVKLASDSLGKGTILYVR